jgi:hypothetical protein
MNELCRLCRTRSHYVSHLRGRAGTHAECSRSIPDAFLKHSGTVSALMCFDIAWAVPAECSVAISGCMLVLPRKGNALQSLRKSAHCKGVGLSPLCVFLRNAHPTGPRTCALKIVPIFHCRYIVFLGAVRAPRHRLDWGVLLCNEAVGLNSNMYSFLTCIGCIRMCVCVRSLVVFVCGSVPKVRCQTHISVAASSQEPTDGNGMLRPTAHCVHRIVFWKYTMASSLHTFSNTGDSIRGQSILYSKGLNIWCERGRSTAATFRGTRPARSHDIRVILVTPISCDLAGLVPR